MTRILAAALAAVLLTCAPAAAQLDTRTIPQASPLAGTERMPAVQGSGCTAKTTPCASVAVTPALIATYLAPTFQPLDSDLTAIAALATVDFGRQLLTKADAAATRSTLGLGTIATQAASGVVISGGAINATPIGASTPSTGAFTNLSASGTMIFNGASTLVGIGTASPQVRLHLAAGDQGVARFRLQNTASGGGTFELVAGVNGQSQSGLSLYDVTAGATRLIVDSTGKVQATGIVQATRFCYTATVCDYAGTGTPLGNVTADVGSTFRRTDGGTSTTFYVKESGSGAATGWVAK